MNVYKQQSNKYKEMLNKYPNTPQKARERMERKIKMLDFIAECTEEDVLELFKTGAFDKIFESYLKKVFEELYICETQRKGMLERLRFILVTEPAELVLKKYERE